MAATSSLPKRRSRRYSVRACNGSVPREVREGRNGTSLDLASLKGKVLLSVNTATGCGLTPQYTGLEQLYAKYHDKAAGCASSTAADG